jgi:hypothetical protein
MAILPVLKHWLKVHYISHLWLLFNQRTNK